MNPEDERLDEQVPLGFDADDPLEEGASSGCLTYVVTLVVALLSMGGGIVLTILALFPLAHEPQQELAAIQAACWLLLRGLALQFLLALALRLLQLDRLATAVVPGMVFLGVMLFLLSLRLPFA